MAVTGDEAARVVIAGPPKAGKTTLAKSLSKSPIHSDSYIHLGWSDQSQYLADFMLDTPGPWVMEGTAMIRALRKFMDQYPTHRPCDRLIYLGSPHVDLNSKQRGMAKQIQWIYQCIYEPLVGLDIEVENRP